MARQTAQALIDAINEATTILDAAPVRLWDEIKFKAQKASGKFAPLTHWEKRFTGDNGPKFRAAEARIVHYAGELHFTPPPRLTKLDQRAVIEWQRAAKHLRTAARALLDVPTGKSDGAKRKTPKRRRGKWDHLWEIIVSEHAEHGCGKDQYIANLHNRMCGPKFATGACCKIDAAKVAEVRSYRNRRASKQNDKTRR